MPPALLALTCFMQYIILHLSLNERGHLHYMPECPISLGGPTYVMIVQLCRAENFCIPTANYKCYTLYIFRRPVTGFNIKTHDGES